MVMAQEENQEAKNIKNQHLRTLKMYSRRRGLQPEVFKIPRH